MKTETTYTSPPRGMPHQWSAMQQLRQENEELKKQLAEANKRNEDLLAWIHAAMPCVRLCANSFRWESAERLLQDAPGKDGE